MARHIRINTIILLLQQGPQTIKSITSYFNGTVSPRQIRSTIDAIKGLGYDNENFEKTGAANRKTWQIKQNLYQVNTYRLVRGTLPQVFALKRQQVLEKLTNWSAGESTPVIESTHFYETEAHNPLDEGLEKVIQAIDSRTKLIISSLKGDATSIYELIQFPLIVLPVRTIYHRGCFYLAAVADTTQQILTFQIDQLTFEETTETFERSALTEMVEANLSNRFGVTQNIDDEIYKIELRFSSVTGKFVSEQFWHQSQQAEQIGDNWYITFHCGINRELVGWLFQWMSNVKISGPLKLTELYNEQLARMLNMTNRPPNEPLEYSNTFTPNNP
ncbi:helix-turn-helix transcriptional regulator [Spirosoma areae]